MVDEARAAGIEHFIFVTGRGKAVIEDHFDIAYELNATLAERGKTKELEALARDQPRPAQTSFTRQQEPLGLGHAVWCAREIVGDEPFAVILPDMLSRGSMKQMLAAYDTPRRQHHRGRGGARRIRRTSTASSRVGQDFGQTFEITGMVEKPPQGTAPSNLIISGRYILQPEVFDLLSARRRGAGNEIQLTDVMIRLMQDAAFLRHALRGRHLRYRLEARLPDGQRRLWAGAGRSRPGLAPGDSRRSCARVRRRGLRSGPPPMARGPPWPQTDRLSANRPSHPPCARFATERDGLRP